MKKNQSIINHLYDEQTIAIGGVDSSLYPKNLIKQIEESGVKNLKLIYIENNDDRDPEGDPLDLIYNGQVSKLVISHLGALSKDFNKYIDELELIPMDIFCFKVQAGANRLPGIVIDYDYAKLYRDKNWLESHKFTVDGKNYVFEPALNADISIIAADFIDPRNFNCKFSGTMFNSADVARCGNMCFAEYNELKELNFDEVDIPGQYINGIIEGKISFYKTNW